MTSEVPDGFLERFEAEVATAMTGMHIPGMSVSIVKDGSVIYARGFGARNLEKNLPATPDTLYGIGSCTKSFTALAIMQLAEKGSLDVRDPVRKHLPFKLGSKENPIRIRHLLSMSSGIPNLGLAEVLLGRAFGVEENGFRPVASMTLCCTSTVQSRRLRENPGPDTSTSMRVSHCWVRSSPGLAGCLTSSTSDRIF